MLLFGNQQLKLSTESVANVGNFTYTCQVNPY